MRAIVTRAAPNGMQIEVSMMGEGTRLYPYRANQYQSEQDSHADAAMRFVREMGMRLDYPQWEGGKLSSDSFVFVATGMHVNSYSAQFTIDATGEQHN